jgi:hypothetical protein
VNPKKRTIAALVSAGTTLVMVVGLGSVAQADPIAAPTPFRTLALTGSDTTDEVMQALAEDAGALATGGTRQVANFSALGSATITTQSGCTAITRPNGSGAGRTALLASIDAANNCVQGARSSSLTLDATGPTRSLVYVPFAREAVTYAVTNTSNVSTNATIDRIQKWYKCQNSTGVVQSNPATKAMLPQSSSGTRKFWLKTLFGAEDGAGQLGANITSNTTTGAVSAGCVENGTDEFGALIQEHQGGKVNDNELVPYSVGQWTSQASGVVASDLRGKTRLAQIESTNPYTTGAFIQRALYNVFPASYVATSNTSTEAVAARALFMGASAQICTNTAAKAIVQRFGLLLEPTCGDTSQQTP